jgi:hypothetical protein
MPISLTESTVLNNNNKNIHPCSSNNKDTVSPHTSHGSNNTRFNFSFIDPNNTSSDNSIIQSLSSLILPHADPTVVDSSTSQGRPVGTTANNIIWHKQCVIAAKAMITQLYKEELIKSIVLGHTHVSMGTFNSIHGSVVLKRNLPKKISYPYNMKKQLQRNTIVNDTGIPIGHLSPLRYCEGDIIDIIIKLDKIGSSLTYGQAIYLINDLIDNTVHQKRLVEWKKQHCLLQSTDGMKKVGNSY